MVFKMLYCSVVTNNSKLGINNRGDKCGYSKYLFPTHFNIFNYVHYKGKTKIKFCKQCNVMYFLTLVKSIKQRCLLIKILFTQYCALLMGHAIKNQCVILRCKHVH